jgi:predicted amidohydrolase YtcJ
MKLTPDSDIPGGRAEKDAGGNLTGVFTGVNRTFNFFTAKIPGPSFSDQVGGTRKYFRELNRLGMTAVNDFPGGGMFPEDFRAVQTLWSKGEMTLRVAFHISSNSQHTLDDFKALTVFTPMNFGDDMLRYRGIGESLTRASMTDPRSGCRIVRAPGTGRSSARWRSGRPNAASMSISMRPAIGPLRASSTASKP